MSRKIAGNLAGAELQFMGGHVVVTGRLLKDTRGTHHTGEARDFSGSIIRTSYIQGLSYDSETDTTTITTRNSIYYSPGNMIKTFLDSDDTSIEGDLNIVLTFVRNRMQGFEYTYLLNAVGSRLTGEMNHSRLVRADNFKAHPHLCGEGETPMCLEEHEGTTDVGKVMFLTMDHFFVNVYKPGDI